MILSCNQNFATQNNDIKEELIDMSFQLHCLLCSPEVIVGILSGDLHLASLVLFVAAFTICQHKFHDCCEEKKA